jgi:ABC-type polysaccharide/polyol phosphate transport system ATPase subunit
LKPLVEVNNVSKRFRLRQETQRSWQDVFIHLFRRERDQNKYFWPLRDVSFTVNPGDSIGVLGPNGSGKSTLLKLISGILSPTVGEITVRGRVASLLELGAGFHQELTGLENVFLNGSIYGMSRTEVQERLDSIISFAELGDFINTPVKHYSSGMYVRLGFSVAIHTDPDLLIVDEVLTVGDTHFQNKCMDAIQLFREKGGTLFLVSHSLDVVESTCTRAIWLDHGRVQADGDTLDVIMQYRNRIAEEENAANPEHLSLTLDSSKRWGTGKVQIVEVEMYDDNGDPRTTFYTGDPMTVRMRYLTRDPIASLTFGMAIHSQSGVHVTGPNTRTGGLEIRNVEGGGEIIFRVPALMLMDGAYVLSVAATNAADSIMYDYHDRAYPFRVYPGRSLERYGLITLGGEWRWIPDAPASEPQPSAKAALVSDNG